MQISRKYNRVLGLKHINGGMYRNEYGTGIHVCRLVAKSETDKNTLMMISSVHNIPVKTETDSDGVVQEYYIDLIVPDDKLAKVYK